MRNRFFTALFYILLKKQRILNREDWDWDGQRKRDCRLRCILIKYNEIYENIQSKKRGIKMVVDNTFIIKKIQTMDGLYAAFSPLTRMPYVECDGETFDDQVYLFATEESIRGFVKEKNEEKIPLQPFKIPKEQMSGFLTSLYALAANMVVYTDEAGVVKIDLEQLAQKPNMEKLAQEKIPVLNPTLTLTVLYFIQELRRPVEHDMAKLKEMEEEMIANIVKSRFILALEDSEKKSDGTSNLRIPFMKTQEGDMYQPIFSDFAEFRKYAGANAQKYRVSNLNFSDLSKLIQKDVKGYVVNPAGFNLVLTREQIKKISDEYEIGKKEEIPEAK